MTAYALGGAGRSHLGLARISAGVKAQLNDAAKVGHETADDLAQLLELARLRVSQHQAAHDELQSAGDGVASERIQARRYRRHILYTRYACYMKGSKRDALCSVASSG